MEDFGDLLVSTIHPTFGRCLVLFPSPQHSFLFPIFDLRFLKAFCEDITATNKERYQSGRKQQTRNTVVNSSGSVKEIC